MSRILNLIYLKNSTLQTIKQEWVSIINLISFSSKDSTLYFFTCIQLLIFNSLTFNLELHPRGGCNFKNRIHLKVIVNLWHFLLVIKRITLITYIFWLKNWIHKWNIKIIFITKILFPYLRDMVVFSQFKWLACGSHNPFNIQMPLATKIISLLSSLMTTKLLKA